MKISGVSTLDYTITPMIDRLKGEVQNAKHIIPEDSMDSWVRGGLFASNCKKQRIYEKIKSKLKILYII